MTENDSHDEIGGIDRRKMLKRSAIVGGALVWTTPVVQSIAGPAFGAEGSETETAGCVGGPFYIKFDEGKAGFTTERPTSGTGTGHCISNTEASAYSLQNGTTQLGQFVTVTFSGTTATITLTGGYTLVMDPTTGAAYSEGKVGPECDTVTFAVTGNPAPGTTVYTATSTRRNAQGQLQAISHVELVVGCPPL